MSLTELQQAERFEGLGGSDAAPALGLSPFKSALALFLEKRERRAGSFENEPMRWGKLLEPVIRQEYAERTGRIVRIPTGTIRHPKHSFMLAHVDGVTDDRRLFEAKNVRLGEGWGAQGTDEVPHHYLIQVQHYLAVVGFDVADIAVLIGGQDFRLYEVPADPELQGLVIDGEADFWSAVENDKPPAPDWSAGDLRSIIVRLYPGTNGATLKATPEHVNWRDVFEQASARAKSYEQAADGAKAHLLYDMGEAARLVFPDGVQLARRMINRKGYTVAPGEYMDVRFGKLKESA